MILILGKEGILHTLGNDIKNVFQNFFTMRGRWQREGDELLIHYSKEAPHATNQRKQYPAKVLDYTDNLLLVGISYDKKKKNHSCKIEHIVKKR